MALAVGLVMGLLVGGGGAAVASHSFPDVPAGHAFHADIDWLADTGITSGYDDDTYRPGLPVTRGSMAAFLRRLAGHDPAVDPVVDAATLGGLSAAQLRHRTVRWVTVRSDGTAVRGTPGASALAYGGFTGQYLVDFGTNVSNCGYVGSITRLSEGAPVAGFVSVRSASGAPNGVFVFTRNASGNAANLDFHLAVFC